MMGSRLELEAHVVTGVSSYIQNLYRVVERAGLEIEGVFAAVHAAGEAVLTPDEKELGVALVDIGGGTTDLAVYQRGSMIFSRSLPLGGEQITGDLAYGLGTTLAQAEVLKMEYRDGLSSPLRVSEVSGQGVKEVPAETVREIMRARLREILEMVWGELRAAGYGSLPGGMVLTGGVASTEGILPLAREITGWPEEVAGAADSLLLPQAAVALGGLRLAAARQRAQPVAARVGRAAWRRIRGFRTWLKEVF
jgi:cell division protein FtsA